MRGFNEGRRRLNAERLRAYFATDGAMSGIRSIHGPLVDMALSGGGSGTRTNEGQINDRRFGWGTNRNVVDPHGNAVYDRGHKGIGTDHRTVRAALMAIDPQHRDILTAAYGPQRRWVSHVARDIKRGMSEEYRDAYGAALLHHRVQNGMNTRAELVEEQDSCEESKNAEVNRRRKAAKVTGVLVWLPRKGCNLQAIGEETSEVLAAAHLAFALEIAKAVKPREKRNVTRCNAV